jgi:hypothetical protein
MVERLTEGDWKFLLDRINNGKLTPFLGAGASFPALPLGETIAAAWASVYQYPGENLPGPVERALE